MEKDEFYVLGKWRLAEKRMKLGLLKMEKTRILAWKDKGVSMEEIAKRLGRHRSPIDRLVAKARVLPSLITPPRKKSSGRP
jgi:transposase